MRKSMNDANEGIEIDLQKLFMCWLANWWIILFCGIFFALAGLIYTTEVITPQYRTGVTFYVNNTRAGNQVESISSSALSSSQQLVQTYIKIVSSDTVLEKVAQEAGYDTSPEILRKMMTAQQQDETELFKVYFSSHDPEKAMRLANATAKVVPGVMAEIVEGSSTKVIDYAKLPESRYSPSYTKNTILSGMFGGMFAVIWITIFFLLDVRIKEAEDLVFQYDYPILGQIPNFDQVSTKRSHKSGYGYDYETAKVTEKSEKPEKKEG